MQFDAELASYGFAFGNQVIEELAGRAESCGCAVMQQGQRANWIRGRVENELGPLCATGILQRNRIHSCASEKTGEFIDACNRWVGWLERTNPRVAFDVVADMSGSGRMARRKRGAANLRVDML